MIDLDPEIEKQQTKRSTKHKGNMVMSATEIICDKD